MVAKRILLVDDEADIQTVARIGLTLKTDWEILSVSSGEGCLQLALSTPLDAILLDVMMPDMDGISTLKALRAASETDTIPVIFLTAKAQAADRRQLYALGAQGVITKPFDPTTLASQVAGFLSWA